MKKRGTSQLDWIMSLAIFLLYIAWFFAFMMPRITAGSNEEVLVSLLRSRFEDEFSIEVIKYPLFLESDSRGMVPGIISLSENRTDIIFIDGTDGLVWNDRLVFLANMSSDKKTLWLVESEDISLSSDYEGLNVEENWTSTENMSINFDDSLLSKASYESDIKIYSASYDLNGISFSPSSTSYNDSGFVAIYEAGTNNINHTCMIFAYSPQVFCTLSAPTDNNYTLELGYGLHDYTDYFSDNNNYGSLQYNDTAESISYSSDTLILYDDESAVSFFFDEEAEITLEYYNSSLQMIIETNAYDGFTYDIMFHNGNYTSPPRRKIESKMGVRQSFEGIYLENLTKTYDELKQSWNFPSEKEFMIVVRDNSSAYSYIEEILYSAGNEPPRNRNVYSEIEDTYAISETGEYAPININYRLW